MVGVVKLEPFDYTFGQYAEMFEAAHRHDWEQTSALIAAQLNCHKKGKPFPFQFFNPWKKDKRYQSKASHSQVKLALDRFFGNGKCESN